MAHAAASESPPVTDSREAAGMPKWLSLGIVFGLVGAASVVLWGPIGVSGTYPRFIGAITRIVDPSYAEANPYLVKMGELFKPETWLVIGLIIGGFVAARTGRQPKAPAIEKVHAMETTVAKRYRDAFLGGLLIVFGARMAGGCTSGHIISGIMQLSISGMIFAAAVFASGIFTAKTLRKGT